MASDYGLNFGFRRSDESLRLSEGRYKTPVGSALVLGTAVEIDASDPGYLKQCAANPVAVPGNHGLLLQEENHLRTTYDVMGYDSFDNGVAKADQLSVITSGAGTKVWFKNTAGQTRADGRVISAVTMFVAAGLVVGERLGWDGTQWVESDGTTIPHWMVLTSVDVAGGYVEAVLTF
jgi:hypothetical protein